MNWQSPHRFIFPYLLEIAISVHSDQVMRWGTGWWQREGRRRKRKWDIVLGDVKGGAGASWVHTLRTTGHGSAWTVDKSAGWGMMIQLQPPVWSQGSTNPEYFMALPSTKRWQNWLSSFGSTRSLKVRVQKQTGKQKLRQSNQIYQHIWMGNCFLLSLVLSLLIIWRFFSQLTEDLCNSLFLFSCFQLVFPSTPLLSYMF